MWIEIYFKSIFYEKICNELIKDFFQLTNPNLNKEYTSIIGKLSSEISLEYFRKKISNLKSQGIDIEWKEIVDF